MPITGKTTVVGVFGDPIAHSLSPAMHNRAFAALDLDFVYVPFHVKPEALGEAVAGVRAMSLAGVNVTVPHKVRVMRHLDEIDPEAAMVGAVNTIVNRSGRLVGYNTDGRGFLLSLERQAGRGARGSRFVVIGAGGAAQAIACSLARAGAAAVTVANRTLEKARALAELIAGHTNARAVTLSAADEALMRALGEADIVVQATSVGMHPHEDAPLPVPVEAVREGALVCDIVYNPRETRLIRAARARGLDVLTGEGMLVYQGAIAFELWTGRPAPDGLMLETLTALLEAKGRQRAP